MTLRIETYLSTPTNPSDQRFVMVVYQEGRGKFKVRRSMPQGSDAFSYTINTYGINNSEIKEDILAAIPMALDRVFQEGALTVSYIEGDALVEFPSDFAGKYDQDKLQQIAENSLKGLTPLIKDYALPLYEEDLSEQSVSALTLCVLVVTAISLIMHFYGSAVLPLEWMGIATYCLGFTFILGCFFSKFTRSLIATGKVLALCFFCASSILLMLLIGVASKEVLSDSLETKEGIIETMFEGTKSDVMRIRLASMPNSTFLVSKQYLKEPPDRLPQAIRIKILKGFFNSHYIREVQIIR